MDSSKKNNESILKFVSQMSTLTNFGEQLALPQQENIYKL